MSKEKCSAKGCDNYVVAKNLCRKHYARMYNKGTLELRNATNGYRKLYFEEYQVWLDMKQRCYNPNQRGYEHYGGKGIEVCKRWLEKPNGFKNFLDDMGRRPKGKGDSGRSKYSIERKDVNGPYSPQNCVWATIGVQANNKSSNIKITIGEETKTLSEWAKFYNIRQGTVFTRYYRGWRGEKLFSPIHSV